MELQQLTPNAEKLLQEILDHRFENGNCDVLYWGKRFEGLSGAEDSHLRSIFKELSDTEMICTRWADGAPYILKVLNNGMSYFEIKEENEKGKKKEKRSDRWHDIWMLIVGAVIGGAVEFALFKFFGVGG